MELRTLGRSGLRVTPLGFGAQTIGGLGYGDQDWSASQPTIDAYLLAGGRFIDTARGYGASEIHVGKALARFPAAEQVVVCSKSGNTHPPVIHGDLEVSRHLVGRPCLDVYYIHVPPTDPAQTRRVLEAYARFREQGLIRLIGLSQRRLASQAELTEGLALMQDPRIDVMQFPYSFIRPEVGRLLDEAQRRGIGVVVRQALEGGMLTDHFRPGHRFTDHDNDWRAHVPVERMEQALRQIEAIRVRFIRPPYTSLAQLALSFVLRHPAVAATIPGAGTPAELRDNLSAANLPPMPADLADELVTAGRGLLELLQL